MLLSLNLKLEKKIEEPCEMNKKNWSIVGAPFPCNHH